MEMTVERFSCLEGRSIKNIQSKLKNMKKIDNT